MRRLWPGVVFLACLAVASVALRAAAPPRLVVMVVIDGFQADYLTTFAGHWRRGFKTLLAEGANFRRVRYPYLTTDTCAGHFTISTGTLPRTHGMVVDDWYDRDARKQVECTDDESVHPVSYGVESMARNSARNLNLPTLADRLREERPGGRVVTLSIKARGAIGLAGHAGDAVTWFDDVADAFITSSAYAPGPVPAVKAFMDSNPYQQDLNAVWTLRDAAATYRHRDAGIGERPPAGWNGLFPHTLAGPRGADGQYATQWQRSGFANAYLGRFALTLLDAYQLGRRDVTDYLGISFTGTDRVGHAFGPDSREYEDIVARLDDVLGDLIASLDTKVGRPNYVLVFSADHGVTPIPATPAGAGKVAAEDVRERIEEVLLARYGSPEGASHVEWSIWGSYFLRAATKARLASDPATVRAVQEAAGAIPGVERLLYTPTLSIDSRDPLVRAASLSEAHGRRGEFMVALSKNWSYITRASADAVHHNAGHDYNQRVPLIFFGAGIRAATIDTQASPADIAPTLASFAGVTMPSAEGRVLREVLPPAASPATR
jgi:predicted AlkP superfamily pyrophosphatase or phosphodiesterase